MDNFEIMARKYVEGVGGLFDLYHYEVATPLCIPPEVEGARWLLISLVNPENRADLDALVRQADLQSSRR